MTFGITLNNNPYSNTSKLASVDANSIREVAQQIFNRAESKSVDLSQADLSKFRRPDVGIDFYNNSTNAALSKQISLQNAGLDVNLNQSFIANIQYLNTQAAQITFQNIQKNMNGKIHVQAAEMANSSKEVADLPKRVELPAAHDLNKDKRGSNPFYVPKKGSENKEDSNANSFGELSLFA